MSIDTVNDLPPRVQYVATASQTVFPYTFPIFQDADLVVEVNGAAQTLTTHYSVSGAGDDTGGNVTFVSGQTAGAIVTIYRQTVIERDSDFQLNGPMFSTSVNDEFDKLIIIAQELRASIKRCLRIANSAQVSDAETELAPISNWFNKYLAFDSLGRPEPAELVAGTITQSVIAALLNPQTASELSAGVTPVNYQYPQGHILRYANNTVPGTTDMADALQAAINSATIANPVVTITGHLGIGRTILIPESAPQNLSIIGTGRTSTVLFPLASNLSVATRNSVAAENVNTLFFNQKDNGHLHLQGFRVLDSVAYTGKFFVAIEGGGGDASGETAFSMVVDDCWFSFSSNNTGIFQGGFSNLVAKFLTFEGTKDACFILQGQGNGDLQFIGCVMNACYDSFIRQEDDGLYVNFLRVDGLQVYQHLRGRIFDLTEAHGMIDHVQVEWDVANLGDCWLARLKDSNVSIANCRVVTTLGTPRGDGGIDITGANTVILSDLKITTDVGLRVQGTGAIDLRVNSCEFDGCQYGFQQLSGSPSGRICFNDTVITDSDEYGMLHSAGTPSFNIDYYAGAILNAGMGGVATSRNINISTSGYVRFYGTRIGQNNGSAAAAYYLRTDGSGTFRLLECPIIGTPPTGIRDTSSTQAVQFIWEPTADLAGAKSFQLATGNASVTVADTSVQANSFIDIIPTNAAAATLMGGAKSLYLSAVNAGTNFTFSTADGTNAAANCNFRYRVHE